MRGSRELAFFLPAVVVLAADQLSKVWVRQNLALGESLPPDALLRLTHVSNAGGVFGVMANPVFLALLNAAVLIILLLFYRRLSSLALRMGLGLVLGGGLGNLVDRLRMGYVTDFIDIRVWPIFNVADASVVVGSVIILYLLFRGKV
jgi:signal peptidase II